MAEHDPMTGLFEANRSHLRAVAYRMLGSRTEADDAVQEAWLRFSRADTGEVGNMGGWLTTVVARVCLDMLRSRKSRREDALDATTPEPTQAPSVEDEALLADSVGLALLVVLETLTPPERVAFVLHDMFDLSFDEIAPIVGRSSVATRQLASRARRRVQGEPPPEADRERKQKVVSAFLAASRGGDFAALMAVLDPNVVLRADAAAVAMSVARAGTGAPALVPETRGSAAVAEMFKGRAAAAQLALFDGDIGLVFAPGGTPRVAFAMTVADGVIVSIDLIADPASLADLAPTMLGG